MESVYKVKDECCGCGACFCACPWNAITMKSDDEGFLYPVINKELCVDCGKCVSVCCFGIAKHKKM